MSRSNIPEVMVAYNVYNEGERLLGIAGEIELPELEPITSSISGAGILGEIEISAPGHFSSLELEIPFRTYTVEAAELNEPKRQYLTFRASQQSYNRTKGINEHQAYKMVVGGKPKGFNPGKMVQGQSSEASAKIEVEYIKIELDNVTLLELDKFNSIYVVNGKDYFEDIRNMI